MNLIQKWQLIVWIGVSLLVQNTQAQIGTACTADPSVCAGLVNGECSGTLGICFCLAGFVVDTGGCSYNCGTLTNPTNGAVDTAGGVVTGDIATYSCESGYQLNGLATRQCFQTTGWGGIEPTCDQGQLGDDCSTDILLCILIGSASCTANTCQCNTGYIVDGAGCTYECGALAAPTDGTVDTTAGTTTGNTATYNCNAGFKVTGSSTTLCVADTGWDNAAPTCTAGVLGDDCSAKANLCDNLAFAECTGTCVCSTNYANSGGTCIRDCGSAPTTPTNGAVTGTNFLEGDAIMYSCNTGFVMTGSATSTCQADGSWDNTATTCNAAVLGDDCSVFTDMCTNLVFAECGGGVCVCSTNYADDGTGLCVRDCGSGPNLPVNGAVTGTDFLEGNSVTLSCITGFRLAGTATSTCQADGSWNNDNTNSFCIPGILGDDCSVLTDLCDNLVFAECDGSSQCACITNYANNGALPATCVRDCGSAPTTPTNGAVTGTAFLETNTVTYSCNTGFVMTGSETATCQADGSWDNTVTTCNAAILGDDCSVFTDMCTNLVFAECGAGDLCACITNYADDSTGLCVRDCLALPTQLTDGGVTANTGLLEGNVATYSCDIGFVLTGTATTTCQADGSWDNTATTCVAAVLGTDCSVINTLCTNLVFAECNGGGECACVTNYADDGTGLCVRDCGSAPGAPTNGAVTGTAFLETNTVTYSCNTGFVMTGSATATCQADGSWDNTATVCIAAVLGDDCSVFTDMCTNLVFAECGAGDLCACSVNYADDGTGLCVRDCLAQPAPPTNGAVTGTAFLEGNTVTYSCDTGFVMEGTATATCQADGSWNNIATTCRQAVLGDDCSVFTDMCTNLVFAECGAGDLCSCSVNYADDGTGLCVRDCHNAPPTPNNGQVASTTFLEGNTITYSCDTGYVLVGLASASCQDDGTWDNLATTCRAAVLGDDCSVFTDMCTFIQFGECNTGAGQCACITNYADDGTGTCVRDCGSAPTAPTNGAVTGTAFLETNTVTYSCNTGFVMTGSATATCQLDGSWDNTVTVCNAAVLGDDCSVFTDMCTFIQFGECNTGAGQCACITNYADDGTGTCVRDCGLLPTAPTSGLVIGTDLLEGDSATYSCNIGFVLVGVATTTCQADGTWDNLATTCRAAILGDTCSVITTICTNLVNAQCGVGGVCVCVVNYADDGTGLCVQDCGIPTITDGSVDFSAGQLLGDSATVTCNTGYNQFGGATISCLASGSWSIGPSCSIKDCGNPTINFGSVDTSSSGTEYQAVATVACNTGYTQSGGTLIECLDTGIWSIGPMCTIKDCGSLNNPVKGSVTTPTGTTYLEQATFTCVAGYDLIGTAVLTCTSTGSWSDSSPTCQIKDCGSLAAPTSGAIDDSLGTTFGSSVTYSCNTGYNLVGVTTRNCLNTGNWDETAPSCVIKDCSSLNTPTNGGVTFNPGTVYLSVATFTCDTGYTLTGSPTRTCASTGTWDETDPTCIIKDCGSLSNPTNGAVDQASGTTYLSVSTFTCNPGYTLTGATSTQCGADASWSVASPTCIIKDCGGLAAPDSGLVDISAGTTYTSIAVFSCNTGYSLTGNTNIVCQVDGTWQTPSPTCVIKDCSGLNSPSNGVVTVAGGTTYGELAQYSCNDGYDLVGDFTRSCLSTGVWSSSQPICQRKDCGSLPDPGNGQVADSVTTYESVAVFTCNTGYSLVGDSTRTCEATGVWSGSNPTCVIKDCGVLTAPTSGSVATLDGTEYEDVAQYTCDTGYTLTGNSDRTCQATGYWSGHDPTCTVNDCGLVPSPTNGAVSTPSGTTYGETATYTCDEGYRIEDGGVGVRICQANSAWSDSSPACVLKDCGVPHDLTNGGFTSFQGYSFGSIATYFCNTNYGLVGTAEVTCESTGFWGTLPVCNPDCGTPPTIDQATIDTSAGTLSGATATYTCDDGYVMSGDAIITCLDTTAWTLEPYCQLSQTAYNEVCSITLQCVTFSSICRNDGNGNSRCLCDSTGSVYDSDIDQCLSDCGGLTAPTNGQISLPTLTVEGQVTSYSCDQGYALSGVERRTCLSTGAWSDSTPLCVTGCPTPTPPTNGFVNTSEGTAAGDVVSYSCVEGYALVGDPQLICLADTTWNGNNPVCSKECPSLASISRGVIDMSHGNWDSSIVTYICDKNYALVGQATRMCESTGIWTGTEPECIFAIFPDVLLVFGSLFVFLILVDIFVLSVCLYVRYCHTKPKPTEQPEPEPNPDEEYPMVFKEEPTETGIPPVIFSQQQNPRQNKYRKSGHAKIAPETPRYHLPPNPPRPILSIPPRKPRREEKIVIDEAKIKEKQKGMYQNKPPGFDVKGLVPEPYPTRLRENKAPLPTINQQQEKLHQAKQQEQRQQELLNELREESTIDIKFDRYPKDSPGGAHSDDSGIRNMPSAAEEDQISLESIPFGETFPRIQPKREPVEPQKHKPTDMYEDAPNRFKARMSFPPTGPIPERTIPADPENDKFMSEERIRRHMKDTVGNYSPSFGQKMNSPKLQHTSLQ